MLFEGVFGSLARHRRVQESIAEDHGHFLVKRLHELLDLTEAEQQHPLNDDLPEQQRSSGESSTH